MTGNETRKERLIKLSETRWAERLDAEITFLQFFLYILIPLETIEEEGDTVSSKTSLLLSSESEKLGFHRGLSGH